MIRHCTLLSQSAPQELWLPRTQARVHSFVESYVEQKRALRLQKSLVARRTSRRSKESCTTQTKGLNVPSGFSQ